MFSRLVDDLDGPQSIGIFNLWPTNHVIEGHFSVMEKLNVGAPLVQVLRLKRKTTMKTSVKFSLTAALLAILMVCSLGAMAQLGKIHGTIKQGGVSIPSAKVSLYNNGQFTGKGLLTDLAGNYEFALLDPGTYTIVVTVGGTEFSQSVSLSPGETQPMNIALVAPSRDPDNDLPSDKGTEIPTIDITDAIVFDVDRDVRTIDRKEIGQIAGPRDINTILASSGAPVFQKDHGDPLNFKGSRDNANATYFDNMKIRGSDQLPLGAIEQVSLMTGGVPAEYGDVLGAVIVVTTRNPSMSMGHVGKPLTRAEKQMLKQQRKKGSNGGQFAPESDLACN